MELDLFLIQSLIWYEPVITWLIIFKYFLTVIFQIYFDRYFSNIYWPLFFKYFMTVKIFVIYFRVAYAWLLLPVSFPFYNHSIYSSSSVCFYMPYIFVNVEFWVMSEAKILYRKLRQKTKEMEFIKNSFEFGILMMRHIKRDEKKIMLFCFVFHFTCSSSLIPPQFFLFHW